VPIFNGEQPGDPGMAASQDDERMEISEAGQLEVKMEAAKTHFLEIATTEGPASEIAITAVGIYHDLLQTVAESKEDRERWLGTEILNTYIAANAVNPEYQEMVDLSREELDMVE